jgi:uncharacterized DUF497 family protein
MANNPYSWYYYFVGSHFEWDPEKNEANKQKHQVSFEEAQCAFVDAKRIIAEDTTHHSSEARYYCIGKVNEEIMTVRFTYRNKKIRIFGAGYWRKGKKLYEETHSLH